MAQISFEIIVDSRFLSDKIWINDVKHKKSSNWIYLCYEYNWKEYKNYKDLPENIRKKIQDNAIKHITNRQGLIKEKLNVLFSGTKNEITTLEKPREISFGEDIQYRGFCSIYKQNGKQKVTLNDIYWAVNSTWEKLNKIIWKNYILWILIILKLLKKL